MKKTNSLMICVLLMWLISCTQSNPPKENLLTAAPHVEDSIVYNIPKTERLCDDVNAEKRYVDVGGCKLYCEIEGEGTPLVLIHGGPGGTHHCFHPWLSSASDKFKLIYYDQRGCGLSDFNAGEGYSFEQTIDDLEQLRKALHIDKWIVLGHSFGGAVAQYYTIKYPQHVLGQILVGAVPMLNKPELDANNEFWALTGQEKQKQDEILQLIMEGKLNYAQYFYNNDINGGWKRENFLKPAPERHSQLAMYDIVFDPSLNNDYGLYKFDNAFDNCPIPTLICEGKYDSLWSAQKVPAMLLNHPNASFKRFEKSSHNIYSDEPDDFIKEISSWAKSIKPAGDNEIEDWKLQTNSVLGTQLQRIQNSKAFAAIIRKDGVEAGIKYYDNFKKEKPGEVLFLENTIILLAYGYLNRGEIEQAIELFKLNIKEYPESWNAYDSLGEAYMKTGNKDLAIVNYKKSVELNPESETGKAALEKLNQL